MQKFCKKISHAEEEKHLLKGGLSCYNRVEKENIMKVLKKTALLLAAACFLGCAGLFGACGEQNEPQKVSYSVTLLDPAGEPLKGVTVKFGAVTTAYKTLESGKTTANLAEGEYEIKLEDLAPIYRYTAVKATGTDRDKTIRLEWDPEEGMVVYTVKVLLPDNEPVKGVSVQLCDSAAEGGTCNQLYLPTNAKGEAFSMGLIDAEFDLWQRGIAPGEYEAQITDGLPDGYTYETNAEGHYTADKVTAEKHEMTIYLKKIEN